LRRRLRNQFRERKLPLHLEGQPRQTPLQNRLNLPQRPADLAVARDTALPLNRLNQSICPELTNGQNATALDTLAAAYHADGQTDRAMTTAESALKVATDAGERELAAGTRTRVNRYRAR
jgi:hypothetical protein